jgi:tetratricopeptide (TPR) repeat protein
MKTPRPLTLLVLSLTLLIATTASAQTSIRSSYNDSAWQALKDARFDEAERLYRAAIREAQQAGTRDLTYAQSLHGLASLLKDQAKFGEAEPLYLESLKLFQDQEGADALNVAVLSGSLGSIYLATARYKDALPCYEHARAIYERNPNAKPGDLAYALDGIARVYLQQARYAEAEPLFLRSLELYQSGGTSDSTLSFTYAALASLNRATGRYESAEQFSRQSLSLREKSLPAGHPDIASGMVSLAAILVSLGRQDEARALYESALPMTEKSLGADHPSVSTILNNLGNMHRRHGRYAEAEALLRRATAIREKTYGADNPNLVLPLGNLAEVGEGALMERALALRRKNFGPDSQAVADSMADLAWLDLEQERFAEAGERLRRALDTSEKTHGRDHKFLTGRLRWLAATAFATGNQAECNELLSRELAILRAQKPQGDTSFAHKLEGMAADFVAAGNWPAAKAQRFIALGMFTEALGPDAPETKRCLLAIADAYRRLGRPTLADFYTHRASLLRN